MHVPRWAVPARIRALTGTGGPTAQSRLAALAVVAGLALAACGDSPEAADGGAGPDDADQAAGEQAVGEQAAGNGQSVAAGDVLPATVPDEEPGVAHVHGLGVNPADGRLYVATHFGLWRLGEPGEAERVGDAHHDLMGFTVVGDDHFVASGHPLVADELPPLLGLIETTDAGETWRSVSLLGSVDFHALRAAHDQVYGWNATDGSFMVSSDHEDWDRRSTHGSLFDFVVSPDDPDRLVATAVESPEDVALERSDDGGRTWDTIEGPPVLRLAWNEPDRLWGIDLDGGVWRSADSGDTWEQTGQADGAPEAVLDTGDALLVSAGGAIAESRDGGESWEELFRSH